jgi:phage protein D
MVNKTIFPQAAWNGNEIRKKRLEIWYNGVNIQTDIEGMTTSFSYQAEATGKSDSISLTIASPTLDASPGLWFDAWHPETDDEVRAKIFVEDWLRAGDNRSIDCGTFVLDAPSGSYKPSIINLKGVSQPSTDGFMVKKNSQVWENVTVQKIAGDIAKRNGLSLVYEAARIPIVKKSQQKATDASFLQGICDDYWLGLKIHDKKLVVFDFHQYKQKKPSLAFQLTDFSSLSFAQKAKYTGCKLSYADGAEEEVIQFSTGGGKRILEINKKADDRADAQRLGLAELRKKNHDATTINFTMIGNPDLVDCITISVNGIGAYGGTYFVDSVSHVFGENYTVSAKASRVEDD